MGYIYAYAQSFEGNVGDTPTISRRFETELKHDMSEALSASGAAGECTTFAHRETNKDTEVETIGITNGRHLYNLRFETDYKDKRGETALKKKRKFVLENDIDWNIFTHVTKVDGGKNYYLNSLYRDDTVMAGINYKGTHKALASVDANNVWETQGVPFPGFLCLNQNDTFTQVIELRILRFQ